jgi:predicted O-methyltransferase YrrM
VNRKLLDPRHKKRLGEYGQYIVSFEEGISIATQVDLLKVREVATEKEWVWATIDAQKRATELSIPYLAGAGFVHLCYTLCRLLKPDVTIETGVAYGWTAMFILSALEKNEKGRLHSIDLPAFAFGSCAWSGSVIPDRLKARWLLHVGSQARLLPRIFSTHSSIDFFHYDSDKTYQGMITTFRSVWPRMSSGGLMISDDLDNDAFIDFAESEGIHPIVVIKPTDMQRVGLLVHP